MNRKEIVSELKGIRDKCNKILGLLACNEINIVLTRKGQYSFSWLEIKGEAVGNFKKGERTDDSSFPSNEMPRLLAEILSYKINPATVFSENLKVNIYTSDKINTFEDSKAWEVIAPMLGALTIKAPIKTFDCFQYDRIDEVENYMDEVLNQNDADDNMPEGDERTEGHNK